jgi:glycerophosphoryl diester phosphodiesterase
MKKEVFMQLVPSYSKESLVHKYTELIKEDGDTEVLKIEFLGELPEDIDGDPLFLEMEGRFEDEELAEIAAELVLTLNGECDRDDFHSWDYDHLEFIISLSTTYDFEIPRNLLNGLQEQLLLLIERENLRDEVSGDK